MRGEPFIDVYRLGTAQQMGCSSSDPPLFTDVRLGPIVDAGLVPSALHSHRPAMNAPEDSTIDEDTEIPSDCLCCHAKLGNKRSHLHPAPFAGHAQNLQMTVLRIHTPILMPERAPDPAHIHARFTQTPRPESKERRTSPFRGVAAPVPCRVM